MSKKNSKLANLEEEFNVENLQFISDEDFYSLILRFTIARDIFAEEKKLMQLKRKDFL